MCGIAGFVQRANGPAAALAPMLQKIAHRGPDGGGEWHGSAGEWSVSLGHRRLSIIDVEGGHQPMGNEDGSVQITFNGEIYNFAALRRSLEVKGHRFQTRSDTETIIHHFEESGPAGLSDLNGMFAFAIWDAKASRLTLARDRVGIKPLYYASLPDGGIAFASELTSLIAFPAIRRELDPAGVASVLFRDYVEPPPTMIRGVYKLKPGNSISWSVAGGLEAPQPFWSLSIRERSGSETCSDASYIAQLRSLLASAVRSQLIADVPVGVFLSGGIDSSIVAALAREEVGDSLHTFSIGFEDSEYDESRFARQVAAKIGSKHIERRFTDGDLLDIVDDAIDSLDEPMADPSIIPTFLLSRLAAQHVKVVLGGDGGDELWAGYPTYRAHQHARTYGAIPSSLRRYVVEPLVTALPVAHGYQRLDWKLKRFALRWQDDMIRRHQHWMAGASTSDLAAAVPTAGVPWIGGDPFGGGRPSADPMTSILAFDFATYLPGSVLTKVDRASMANGLEVRPPLLDNELIDFAFSLPSSLKLRGRGGKWLLKRAAVGLVPDEILTRRKKGFGVPMSRWMRSHLQQRIAAVLSDSPLWSERAIQRSAFADWNRQHLEGRHDYSRPLWSLLVMDRWMRRIA